MLYHRLKLIFNNLQIFQEKINYPEIPNAQADDKNIQSLLHDPTKSGLKISEVRIDDSEATIICQQTR